MPNKQKVAMEEKVEYVRACLRGEITQGRISKAAGVSLASVQVWIKRYKAEGVDGFYTGNGNKVYAPETKTMAVLDYLSGKGSQTDICQKYKIRSKTQLQKWIKVYNAHGDLSSRKHSGGGSYMSKARNTTQEERLQIVQECLASDKNYGEMAKKHKVSYQQVYNWTNKFAEQGEAGLEDRRGQRTAQQAPRTAEEELRVRIAQLEHELYMTKMERDLLKKLDEIERRRS